MLRQPPILLLVALEMLLLPTLHATIYILITTVGSLIVALDDKEILVVRKNQRVACSEGTLAERQIEDGIEEVGLARTIMAYQAVDLRRKDKVCSLDILKVYYGNPVEYHYDFTFIPCKVTTIKHYGQKKSTINFNM